MSMSSVCHQEVIGKGPSVVILLLKNKKPFNLITVCCMCSVCKYRSKHQKHWDSQKMLSIYAKHIFVDTINNNGVVENVHEFFCQSKI